MERRLTERLRQLYGREFETYAPLKFIDNSLHVSVDHKYIYCDIPKAGCTTIKKTLIESVEKKLVDYDVHNRAKSPLLRPSDVISDIKELAGYFKFTFVRNPYTKVLSAYLDKIKGNKMEKRAIVKVLGMDIDVPFKLFLDALASMESKRMDTHFKPQVMQSCYPMMNYNFIGKFETFEADLIAVLGRVGRKEVSRGMIKTIRHHQTNASVFYDLETENLVKEIYRISLNSVINASRNGLLKTASSAV